MKIIVKEDHRAPVMVSQVWYKVGSSYEDNGTTGLSHVLEHMMFKGTKKHGPNEFSRIIAENGGRENAFTGRDYTAYFQTMEKRRLPVSLELESDRMSNLVLLEEEFKKEVQVVMEERRMRTEDNPQSMTYEQFSAIAYINNPYHHPVIGWMNDLENMQLDDLAHWYKRWYVPNNATLVVAGDVNAGEVFALAEKYFGSIPAGKVPKLKPRKEIEQKGERRIVVKAPAQLPFLILGYKVPSIKDASQPWEPYALEVMAAVLDGGNSARLSRDLVRGSEVAAEVGVGYDSVSPHEELFMFSGTPNQGKQVADLEQAIQQQLGKLKKDLVTQAELDRVKAQVVAGKVYEQDSTFYQAMTIGMLETTGFGWPLVEQYLDNIKAVTPEQVREVARKYFIDDNLTVAVLDPQPLDQKRPVKSGGGRHAN
ncbi:MAG: insulinase family protein [Gammaproteobacteria bacterium]|nr:insulinase family protein [Gammaproteobacteria bacterium]